jgi:hypothetical protein
MPNSEMFFFERRIINRMLHRFDSIFIVAAKNPFYIFALSSLSTWAIAARIVNAKLFSNFLRRYAPDLSERQCHFDT